MKEIINRAKDFFKQNRNKILIALGVFILINVTFIIYNYFKKNNYIYVEVASNQLNYVYGPNNSTFVNMKIGDSLKVKIITEKGKKHLVKCQSNDERIIKFKNKDTINAYEVGEAEIYCKLNNNISNIIEIKVVD